MEECHRLLTDQVDLVNTEGHRLMPDVSKPLPLGGPPGHITIQPQFFFNKDLEYLISGDTASRDVCAAYGILHWWFKRKEFYITRHNAPSDHHAVRSHMQIDADIDMDQPSNIKPES
ncbi:hypothetical protein Tco_0580378 [Tanacetum coccineum]